MAGTDAPPVQPAVIVAGMHRSGTSLTSSLLIGAGIHMGESLLGPGPGNPAGYFEDSEIYEFHKRVLTDSGIGPEGFTTRSGITVPECRHSEAEAIVNHRRRRVCPWGWKEPRTTLFLDFWAGLVPEAVFLLVFRRPWEVVDSLFRRGDPAFAADPEMAPAVWLHYNLCIERFLARHPGRCLLVELPQVVRAPEAVLARLESLIGRPLAVPPSRYRSDLLVQDPIADRVRLLDAIDRGILDCYFRLRDAAGSASHAPDRAATHATGPVDVVKLLAQWRRDRAPNVPPASDYKGIWRRLRRLTGL